MQVGVHLWHEGPAGGLQYDLKPQPLNTYIPQCAASTTEPSPTPTEPSPTPTEPSPTPTA